MSMLPESFKSDVLEIIEIAKACPEALQARCLEMLLGHYLNLGGASDSTEEPIPRRSGSKKPAIPPADAGKADGEGEKAIDGPPVGATSANGGGDIVMGDLHVKAKKFLEKHGRSLADVNDLFYKDGSEFRPLYDDLKTTKASESQIRIALLHALVAGLKEGEFQFDGEKVREECQIRKAYDVNNFSANFNNNAMLFDTFEKYSKTSSVIRLSEAGRKRLADLIPEMK